MGVRKYIKYIGAFILGGVLLGSANLGAVQVSVPSATVPGQILVGSSTGNYYATGTWPFSFGSLSGTSTATSTLNGGLNIARGCFAVNGTCVSGSGTPGGSNTQVQFNDGGAFGGDSGFTWDKSADVLFASTTSFSLESTDAGGNYASVLAANGNAELFADLDIELAATRDIIFTTNPRLYKFAGSSYGILDFSGVNSSDKTFTFPNFSGLFALSTSSGSSIGLYPTYTNNLNVGIGTTSPFAKLSVHANNGETNRTLFAVGSSTASATTTFLTVSNKGVMTFFDGGTITSEGTLNISSGGDGLPLNISTSNGITSGSTGGDMTWTVGSATAGNAAGGLFTLTGGVGSGSGQGSILDFYGGNGGATGDGGLVELIGGTGGTGGTGGGINLNTGTVSGGNGTGGDLVATLGAGSGINYGGSFLATGGDGGSFGGHGGDMSITAGRAGSATGTNGVVYINGGQGLGPSLKGFVLLQTSTVGNTARVGIGTTTPVTKLHISAGANATTTVTIGELGLSTSKSCVNMNQLDGSAASFYISGGAIVVETNYCR